MRFNDLKISIKLAVAAGIVLIMLTIMVEQAINNIKSGNNLVETTFKQLEEIVESASKSADLVEEIVNASKEQTQGLDQINQGLEQIDRVTQSNTANAEESASTAEELAYQAQQLRAIVSRFKFSTKLTTGLTGKDKISAELIEKIKVEMGKNQVNVFSQKDHLDKLHDVNEANTKSDQPQKTYIDHEDIKDVDIKAHKPIVDPRKIIELDDQDFGKF